MSILDGPAVPTRVVGVMSLLHRAGAGGHTLAELNAVMLPDSVRKIKDGAFTENTMAQDSLEVCTMLGLVEPASRAEAYRLTKEARALGAPAETGYAEGCAAELIRRILSGQRAERSGAAQYDLLVWVWAWYLDLSPDEVPADNDHFWQQIEAILPPGCKKRSTNAYGQFRHWGKAAGLLSEWTLKAPSGRAKAVPVVNPAPFLRRHLGDAFKPRQETAVDEWLAALNERFPIFDGGKIRREVRSTRQCGESTRTFSPSLELALRQLRDEGLLAWRPETDAPAYFLTLSGNDPVAYLTYLPGGRP